MKWPLAGTMIGVSAGRLRMVVVDVPVQEWYFSEKPAMSIGASLR